MSLPFLGLVAYLAFVYFEPAIWFPWLAEYRVALIIPLVTLVVAILRGARLPRAPQHALFILLLLTAVISTLFSIEVQRSLDHLAMLMKGVAFYFLVVLVVQSARSLRALLNVILIYGGLTTVATLITSKLDISRPGNSDLYRLSSFFGGIGDGPNEFGALLLALLPLPLCLLEADSSVRKKVALTTLALAIMLCITRTRSRGAFVGVVVVLGLLLLESRWRLRLALLLAPLVALVILYTHSGYWDRIATLESAEAIRAEGGAYGRLMQAQYALQLMALRPFTGVGLGNFVHAKITLLGLDPQSGLTQHVEHSAYLAIGAEIGVLGMLILLAILGVSVLQTYRSQRILSSSPELYVLSRTSKAIRIGLIGFATAILFLSEQYNSILYQWVAFIVILRALAQQHERPAPIAGAASPAALPAMPRVAHGALHLRDA